MNVLDALKCRKSIRSYKGQITKEELDQIMVAAQSAPIGRALYDTMRLHVIQDPDFIAAIDENAAKSFGDPDCHPLYGAETLIIISTKIIGNPGADNVAYSNAAIISENIALEAVELGIGSCHIWGAMRAINKNEELLAKLDLPEGFMPVCSMILGKTDEVYEEREIPMDRIEVTYI